MAKSNKSSTPPVGVPQPSNAPKFIGGAAVLIALCLVIALVVTKPWQSDENQADNTPQFQPVSASGDPLPQAPEQGQPDPGVGATAPTLNGQSFDGTTVNVAPDGKPKALFFFAHWCPHCQAEIPTISKWIKDNGGKYDVEYIGVATGTDPRRANFPPSAWFQKENWSTPVLADSSTFQAANSYGLASYPYAVFLDGQNKVVARASGKLDNAKVTSFVEQIANAR